MRYCWGAPAWEAAGGNGCHRLCRIAGALDQMRVSSEPRAQLFPLCHLPCCSAVFNGSFGAFTKLRKARGVSPLVMNYWMAEGLGISGLLLLAVPNRVGRPQPVRVSGSLWNLFVTTPGPGAQLHCTAVYDRPTARGSPLSGADTEPPSRQVFTWYGVLSGALFVASSAHAVTAISLVGLAAATGVWCGTAVLVSFAWGVAVAGDQVQHMGLAAAALALILVGIAGIVASAAGGQPWGSVETLAELTTGPEGEMPGGAAGRQRHSCRALAPRQLARWQSAGLPGVLHGPESAQQRSELVQL